jgi:hypothetical protein
MDKITKNMIPNAHSAERNQKVQCDIHQVKYGPCAYFDSQMLPLYFDTQLLTPVAHTFTKNVACKLHGSIFCDGKKTDAR